MERCIMFPQRFHKITFLSLIGWRFDLNISAFRFGEMEISDAKVVLVSNLETPLFHTILLWSPLLKRGWHVPIVRCQHSNKDYGKVPIYL